MVFGAVVKRPPRWSLERGDYNQLMFCFRIRHPHLEEHGVVSRSDLKGRLEIGILAVFAENSKMSPC